MRALIPLLLAVPITAAAQEAKAPMPEPAWKATLVTELPKLTTLYRVRQPKPLNDETRLSREYYRRLLRYVRLTDPRMRDWPHASDCRYHKVDDHNEMAVRQNATVAFGYSTLLAGDFDPAATGVSREKIADDLNALLRYIAITHKANFLPTGDGELWGDQWQSAFWACIAGKAAWNVWDHLDDDVRLMVARMVEHEADRFNERPPDSGVLHDTKAEENAWNSEIIALAGCMFPDHPRSELWRERAIVYMLNSFVREADRDDERIIDGRPARERISAATIHPDFTLENHNRVHPDYMGTINLLLHNALLYEPAGLPLPESMTYNVPEVWSVLQKLTATNASLFYVNGQDWWLHQHDIGLTNAAFASVLSQDPDAAFVERSGLEFTGRMHARFEDGSLWDEREYNYRNAEEDMICWYAELYLIHRTFGDGPEPSSREQFLRHQSGTFVFESGGFIVHRTPAKFCSFAWVNGAMGLVYPSDDTWFTSPSERGMVGRIACEGTKDSTPVVEEYRVGVREHGFSLAARIARCEGKIEQTIALFSLPDGPVIYLERIVARENVRVTEVATATAPILNEDAPGISPNRRTLIRAGGAADIPGVGGEAQLLVWETPWANLDGKLGVLSTTGRMAYRDQNAYARSRLEEELIANYYTSLGEVPEGQQISACAVAFIPNQGASETEFAELRWEQSGPVVAAKLRDSLVVANLGDARATAGDMASRAAFDPLEAVVLAGSM